jgi:hypothetical protein
MLRPMKRSESFQIVVILTAFVLLSLSGAQPSGLFGGGLVALRQAKSPIAEKLMRPRNFLLAQIGSI